MPLLRILSGCRSVGQCFKRCNHGVGRRLGSLVPAEFHRAQISGRKSIFHRPFDELTSLYEAFIAGTLA